MEHFGLSGPCQCMPSQLVERFPPFRSWLTQSLGFRAARPLSFGGRLLRTCCQSRPNAARMPLMREPKSVASLTRFSWPCAARFSVKPFLWGPPARLQDRYGAFVQRMAESLCTGLTIGVGFAIVHAFAG